MKTNKCENNMEDGTCENNMKDNKGGVTPHVYAIYLYISFFGEQCSLTF